MSEPLIDAWKLQWGGRYPRRPSQLSKADLGAIEIAAGATRISPGKLLECFLRENYDVLTTDEEQRLLAWYAKFQLHVKANQVYEAILEVPDMDAPPVEQLAYLLLLGRFHPFGDSSSPPPSAGGESDHANKEV